MSGECNGCGGMTPHEFQGRFQALQDTVCGTVVTSTRTVRLALLGLVASGHVLVEDRPGVGKTLLAKSIAQAIDGRFSRVQFTPDLLPSDITGSSVFNAESRRFEFLPGPVFANILLADELNRTNPRTQSALLDVQMPGMDGLNVTRRLREMEAASGRHLPVVGVTASALPEDRARCLAAGMDGYVAKPFNVAEVLGVLAQLTGSHGPVDTATALARLGGDTALLQEAAAEYITEGPRMTAALREAVAAGDADALVRAVHTLSGAAGVFGAQSVVDHAAALERRVRDGHGPWTAAAESLAAEADGLLEALRSLAA